MSKPSQSTKRLSRHVFFVDENLGSIKLPDLPLAAGYKIVTHFERYGNIDGIADPVIIADCGIHKNVLLTADADLETTWAAEVMAAKLAVVILTNNSDGADKWGARLTVGQQMIVEMLRKHKKPCALSFGCDSKVGRARLYGKRRAKVIMI